MSRPGRSPHSSQQGRDPERCRHGGYYSAVGLYSKDSRTLRYVFVCDDCGEEMKEISTLDYAPQPVFEGF
jgi:hypothetical protein